MVNRKLSRAVKRPHWDVKIDGVKVNALLDSGAEVTVIHQETWKEISRKPLQASRTRIRAANGGGMDLKGEINVEIEWPGGKIVMPISRRGL